MGIMPVSHAPGYPIITVNTVNRQTANRQTAMPLVLALIATLSACGGNFGFPGVYRINVEQGNIVNEEIVAKLKPGMSRRQVRFIMGTPMIEDTFHAERWDYRYVLRNGNDVIRENRVGVVFEDDKLVDVTGDLRPVWAGGTAGQETTGDS